MCGKPSRKKEEAVQYIGYELSERFTKADLEECLTELVNRINKLSDTKYALTLPESENRCPMIGLDYSSKEK